ncbi:unnamed protein product [Prunus brigantina]
MCLVPLFPLSSTLVNKVNLIIVICVVSLLVTLLLRRVICAIIHLSRRYCSWRENNQLLRSGAEDDALGFKTTGRQDGHNQSSGFEPKDDAHGFKTTDRKDGHDRSSGSESDDFLLCDKTISRHEQCD